MKIYGFWAAEDGSLIEVAYEAHEQAADKYIKQHLYKEYLAWVQKNDGADPIAFCLSRGWVRLVNGASNTLNIEFMQGSIDKKALRATIDYITENLFKRFIVGISEKQGEPESYDYADYEADQERALFSTLRKNLRKNTLEAADKFDSNAWWITSEAKVLEVGADNEHGDVAAKYFKRQLFRVMDSVDYALEQGWIRVRKDGNVIYVNAMKGKYTRESLHSCTKLLTNQSADYLEVEIVLGQHDELPSEHMPFSRAGISRLSAIMRKHAKQELVEANDKMTVTIDEDNNRIIDDAKVLESWSDATSGNKIHLLEMPSLDYVIQYIKPNGDSSVEVFRFLETARDALLQRVNEVRNQNNQMFVRLESKDYPDDAQTYTLKVNDGDGSLLRILKAIKYLGDVGASRTVTIEEGGKDHKDLKLGFDGDGADKIYEILVDNKLEAKSGRREDCWIKADGKVLECNDELHVQVFRRYLDQNPDVNDKFNNLFPSRTQQAAYLFATRDLGWIRVAAYNEFFNAMICRGKTSTRAYLTLAKMVKDGEYTDYILGFAEDDRIGDTYDKTSTFLSAVRQSVDKSNTITASATYDNGKGVTILERWEGEIGGNRYAFELATQGKGFDIISYIYAPLVKMWKKQTTSYLGKADEAQARQKFVDYLKPYQKEIQEVELGKALPPEPDNQNYKDFRVQPEVKGLRVVAQKIGSYQYAKVIHMDSGRTVIPFTKKPLAEYGVKSVTELVQRIDNSKDLSTIDWTLSPVQLERQYSQSEIKNRIQRFTESLALPFNEVRTQGPGKTQVALDAGLREIVRDYLVAYYTRSSRLLDIGGKIDKRISQEGLDSKAVYNVFGDRDSPEAKVWEKVGLVRVGDKSPYKYVTKNRAETMLPPKKYTVGKTKHGKAFASVFVDGKNSFDLAVNDLSVAKTIADVGNALIAKTKPEVPDNKYLHNLTWEKDATAIYPTDKVYSNGKLIGKMYLGEGTVQTVLIYIRLKLGSTPKVQTEKNSTGHLIGKYVEGVGRDGNKYRGILQRQVGKKYPDISGEASVLVDGRMLWMPLVNIRRTMLNPPAELLKVIKKNRLPGSK